MRVRLRYVLAATLSTAFTPRSSATLIAQPDFSTARDFEGVRVYKDFVKDDIFYYAPGHLFVAENSDGRPDFRLLSMRYTGTRTMADAGEIRFRNLLSLGVTLRRPDKELLDRVARRVAPAGTDVQLQPLPGSRLEAVLGYSSVSAAQNGVTETEVLPPGEFNSSGVEPNESVFWTERTYTLNLDNASAQILLDLIDREQVLLTVGYALFADGVRPEPGQMRLDGPPELVEQMQQRFDALRDSAGTEVKTRLVFSDLIEVPLDAKRWPELVEKVDINDRLPPGYPLLDVYCFDFRNEIRSDLYSKLVDLEATGVGGEAVRVRVAFRQTEPDGYVQHVQFPYAVRVNEPFRYRVTEITNDGDLERGIWETRESWTELLDVTTPQATTELHVSESTEIEN